MKKLSTALALILCLVLCLFAFASCSKKGKTEDTTKVPDTTPGETEHVHDWETDYTIDKPTSCSEAGSKSIHCKTCDEKKNVTPIAKLDHTPDAWEDDTPATLLAPGKKITKCTVCQADLEEPIEFVADVQTWTSESNGYYSPTAINIGDLRGDKHFYDEGNDLLVEYSILWNDSVPNLSVAEYDTTNHKFYDAYMDTRLSSSNDPKHYNKNLIYWSLADDVNMSDCKFAGGFDWGGIDKNMDDNPYPKFTKDPTLGTTKDEYPNIGGANGGDGTPQGENLWGWHRVSIRYSPQVTNLDELKADTTAGATKATYRLEMWVYIDGELVIHAYQTDHTEKKDADGKKDRKLFSVESDGQGGVVYTENDYLYLHPTYVNSKKAVDGETVYFAIADCFVTIGSNFVQQVFPYNNPEDNVTIEVADGVTKSAKMYYALTHDHVWEGEDYVSQKATLLADGVKYKTCKFCGTIDEANPIDYECEPFVLSSNMDAAARTAYNKENKVDWLNGVNNTGVATGLSIKENINRIKEEDQHYYPTPENLAGNDLLVEVSFLWNESLAESKYDWRQLTFAHVDGYDVFNVGSTIKAKDNRDNGKTGAEKYAYVYKYITPTPAEIEADATVKTPSLGEYGWHRLGFRVHQEAKIVADQVVYTYIASVYVDGELKIAIDMTDYVVNRNKNSTVTALLYTANINAEDPTKLDYYDIGKNPDENVKYKTSYAMLIFEEFFKKADGYLVFADLEMSCGNTFAQTVVKNADPADATFTLDDKGTVDTTDDLTCPAKMWYKLAD